MRMGIVFEFEDGQKFLNHIQGAYPGYKKPITLGQWARRLGFRSPRAIAMILKGQRQPTDSFVEKIASDLHMKLDEKRYWELLARKWRLQHKGLAVDSVDEELRSLQKLRFESAKIESDLYPLLLKWYTVVIRELVGTPDFHEEPAWIVKRLRGKISVQEADLAIRSLLQAKIIERKPDGKLGYSVEDSVSTGNDIPSRLIREYHKDMLERAKESLDELGVLAREIRGVTIRMAPDKLEELKQMVRGFMEKVDVEFDGKSGDDIYQMNIQVFPHTSK